MDQCFSSPWDRPGNRGSDTTYLDVGVHENPNEYGGAILESGIIELPATEVSSSPWSCNRNRKAVRKSTSPTEITLASVSARAVAVAREFLGIRNSVGRYRSGCQPTLEAAGFRPGVVQLTFGAGVLASLLVGVARDKCGSHQFLEWKNKGIDLPGTNAWFVL